jgi:DNA primase
MARKVAKAPAVNFTNLHKVFFPASKFTKGDLIKYYVDVAPYLIPHFENRPVTLIRMPDGVHEKFYEKNAPGYTPDWLETTRGAKVRGWGNQLHRVERRTDARVVRQQRRDRAAPGICAHTGAIFG